MASVGRDERSEGDIFSTAGLKIDVNMIVGKGIRITLRGKGNRIVPARVPSLRNMPRKQAHTKSKSKGGGGGGRVLVRHESAELAKAKKLACAMGGAWHAHPSEVNNGATGED